MASLLPIGQFVQLTGLSARMVRFYEKLGILLPTRVEPHNSYRYYDYEQTLQAEKIRLLRSLEMSLEEIKQLLGEAEPERIRAKLHQHRLYIEDKIASYRQALAALEILEDNQGALYSIRLKDAPAQIYLSLYRAIPLSQVDRGREMALNKLQAYARAHHQSPAGPAFAIVGEEQNQDPLPDVYPYEFGLPLSQEIPAGGEITLKHLPARRAASATHIGPYEPLHLAFRELNLWCHQHQRDFVRMMEIYHLGPLESGQPEHYRTEVQYVLEEAA